MRHTDHHQLSRPTPLNPTPFNPTPFKRALSALVGTLSLLMLLCMPSVQPLHAKPIKVKGHDVEVGGTIKDSSKSFLLKGELLSKTSEGIYVLTQQDGFAVENQCPTFIPLKSIDFVRVKVSQIKRFGHPLLDTALLTGLSITNGFLLLLTLPAALIAGYFEHRAQHNLIEREFRGGSRMLRLYTRFPSNYTYENYPDCTSLEEGLVNFKPIKTLPSNALALRGLGRRFQLRLGGVFQYWDSQYYYENEILIDEQSSYGVSAQLLIHITQRWSLGLGVSYLTPREVRERISPWDEREPDYERSEVMGGFEPNLLLERVLYQGELLELLAQVSAKLTNSTITTSDQEGVSNIGGLATQLSLGLRFPMLSTTQLFMLGWVNSNNMPTEAWELSWQIEF